MFYALAPNFGGAVKCAGGGGKITPTYKETNARCGADYMCDTKKKEGGDGFRPPPCVLWRKRLRSEFIHPRKFSNLVPRNIALEMQRLAPRRW